MQRVLIPERWERIIQLVEKQGGATIEEIAQTINISPATVRRDLTHIHERGLIERKRGGAVPGSHLSTGPTLAESRTINPGEKILIGRTAANFIMDHDLVLLDGGFTACQVARHMTASNVTVITNSLDVIQTLISREDITLIMAGGEISRVTGTTLGPSAESLFSQLSVGKTILGADALSPEEGLCCPVWAAAQTKKAMVACARELIVVADHSKLGGFALHRVAPVTAITTLVTDDQSDPKMLDEFRHVGIEVIIASESATR